MKNIHLIPTKSSHLFYHDCNKQFSYKIDKYNECKESSCKHPQNIYITSDEEIKEGDWVIQVNFEKTNTQLIQCVTEFQVKIANDKNGSFTKKKIILTTDKNLIKDGVQAIDDEFLEWFVKNPSCEEVEIKPLLSNNGRALFGYKIIIPKEEPKQCDICNMYPRLEGTNKCEGCYSVARHFFRTRPRT